MFKEYVDQGVSGAKERRPALDDLLKDATRRRFDVVACWRLDRLGRNLRHLVTMLEDLNHVGVAFVSLGEGIDCTTPAGKLQLHILAALAEFERGRIRERIHAGIARARREGKRLGRRPHRVTDDDLTRTAHLSQHEAAKVIGVPRSVLQRARAARNGVSRQPTFAPDSLLAGPCDHPCPLRTLFGHDVTPSWRQRE